MRHRDGQGPVIPQVGGGHNNLQQILERDRIQAVGQFNAEQGAAMAEQALGAFMLRMMGQAGMENLFDFGVG